METGFPQSPLSYRPYKYPQDMIAWLIFFILMPMPKKRKERYMVINQQRVFFVCWWWCWRRRLGGRLLVRAPTDLMEGKENTLCFNLIGVKRIWLSELYCREKKKIMALVRAPAVLMEWCSSAGAPANQLFNSANFWLILLYMNID